MTTWTNSNATKTRPEFLGKSMAITYTITGVAGDTGGALNTGDFKIVDNYSIQVEVATGPAGYSTNLTHFYDPATPQIAVGYDNPADDHTIRIKVWGPK
jgi:hypothetical protein